MGFLREDELNWELDCAEELRYSVRRITTYHLQAEI